MTRLLSLLAVFALAGCAPQTAPPIEPMVDVAITCLLERSEDVVTITATTTEDRPALSVQVNSLGPISYQGEELPARAAFAIGELEADETWSIELTAPERLAASVYALQDGLVFITPCGAAP